MKKNEESERETKKNRSGNMYNVLYKENICWMFLLNVETELNCLGTKNANENCGMFVTQFVHNYMNEVPIYYMLVLYGSNCKIKSMPWIFIEPMVRFSKMRLY